MNRPLENALNWIAWAVLVLVTAPLYLTFKLIDWIKDR